MNRDNDEDVFMALRDAFDAARRNESVIALYQGVVLTFLIAASLLDPAESKWVGVLWVVMMLGGAGPPRRRPATGWPARTDPESDTGCGTA